MEARAQRKRDHLDRRPANEAAPSEAERESGEAGVGELEECEEMCAPPVGSFDETLPCTLPYPQLDLALPYQCHSTAPTSAAHDKYTSIYRHTDRLSRGTHRHYGSELAGLEDGQQKAATLRRGVPPYIEQQQNAECFVHETDNILGDKTLTANMETRDGPTFMLAGSTQTN